VNQVGQGRWPSQIIHYRALLPRFSVMIRGNDGYRMGLGRLAESAITCRPAAAQAVNPCQGRWRGSGRFAAGRRGHPRAAASNSAGVGPTRPSAWASSRAVSCPRWRGGCRRGGAFACGREPGSPSRCGRAGQMALGGCAVGTSAPVIAAARPRRSGWRRPGCWVPGNRCWCWAANAAGWLVSASGPVLAGELGREVQMNMTFCFSAVGPAGTLRLRLGSTLAGGRADHHGIPVHRKPTGLRLRAGPCPRRARG
jgi:hypothetical protein